MEERILTLAIIVLGFWAVVGLVDYITGRGNDDK